MALTFAKTIAAPLLCLNFIMYILILALATLSIRNYINYNGESYGNGATMWFLIFALLGSMVGIWSKVVAAKPVWAWRSEGLAAIANSSLFAWFIIALAFGFALKEIDIGGYRGLMLKIAEGITIILFFTQLLYVAIVYRAIDSGDYGTSVHQLSDPVGGARV